MLNHTLKREKIFDENVEKQQIIYGLVREGESMFWSEAHLVERKG